MNEPHTGNLLKPFIRLFRSLDYKWVVFAVIAIGMFSTLVDQTSLNLALPRIASYFDASIPTVQWINLGYVLIIGTLLLPCGRMSDIVGRRKVYVTGFIVFTLGAVLSGSAPSLLAVIMFKLFQGIGAAMIQANAMAILTSAFPSQERGKAIGLFTMIVGLGAIVGPILGGLLVGMFGWRSVFFMGVPVGIISVISALTVLRPDTSIHSKTNDKAISNILRFDWIGSALSATALAIFLLIMTNAYLLGWLSVTVILGLTIACVLLLTFIWWEKRTSEPILAVELFKNGTFSMGIIAGLFCNMIGTSIYYLMPFYIQDILNHSPQNAGLIMTSVALFYGLSGPIAGRLSDLYGWYRFTITGLILLLMSLIIFVQISPSTPVWLVILGLSAQGVGMGTFTSPNISSVLSVVTRNNYGIVTALLNLMRNTGTMIGLGLATTIFTSVMISAGFEPNLEAVRSSGASYELKAAFTNGLRVVYVIMSGFTIASLILTVFQGRLQKNEQQIQ